MSVQYELVKPSNKKSKGLSRDDCLLDFWATFVNSVCLASGSVDINYWKKKTLQELGEVLAQNGIRFTYSKDKVISD